MLCHTSLAALIMCILASFVNSNTIHKVLVLNKLTMRTSSGLPPQWRQRGQRQTIHRPTYSVARVIGACMARRFHLSKPLFVLPCVIHSACHMDQWPQRCGL